MSRATGAPALLVLAACAHGAPPPSGTPPGPAAARAHAPTSTPAPAPAPPTDPAALASADLAAVVAHDHIAGRWRIGPLAWNDVYRSTMGEAWLVFDADASDPLADPPYVTADTFQVDAGPPPRMITHALPDRLARAARHLAEIPPALALARDKLKALPRYTGWQHMGWHYRTRIDFDRKGHVYVIFDLAGANDTDVSVEIDPATRTVVAVRIGSA